MFTTYFHLINQRKYTQKFYNSLLHQSSTFTSFMLILSVLVCKGELRFTLVLTGQRDAAVLVNGRLHLLHVQLHSTMVHQLWRHFLFRQNNSAIHVASVYIYYITCWPVWPQVRLNVILAESRQLAKLAYLHMVVLRTPLCWFRSFCSHFL